MEGARETPNVGNQSVAPEQLTNEAYGRGNGHEGSLTGEGAQAKAEKVLEQYRVRFISDMDAKAVIMELVHKGIISRGDESEILMNEDPRLRNQKLHSCLMNKCTKEALTTVCCIIIEVKGNPKMKALGEHMKRSLSEACAAVQPQEIVDSSRSTSLAKTREDKQHSTMGPDQAPDESSGGVAQTEVIPRGVAASQFSVSRFLETYEKEFLEVVNPTLSLLKLKHKGVISADVRTAIESANDEDAKYILLEHLQKNATVDTMRVYCDVAIAANGFPRMQELGKKMMDALPPGEGELTGSVKGGRMLRKRPSTSKEGEATYLKMNDSRRKALRRCHPDLRRQIAVTDFLPSLHVDADGFLTDLESSRIRKHTGNMEQVDELIDILVTKENNDFDHFCVVLEKDGYHVWSEKLIEAAGLERELTESVKGGQMLRKRPSSSQEVEVAFLKGRDSSYSAKENAKEGKIVKFNSTINLPPMPIALQVISSVLLEGKVYVTGVANEKASKDNTTLQVQVYSLDEAEWSTLPRATIYNARLVVMDGRITLIGGRSVETKKITDVWATWFEEEGRWKESWMNTRLLETGVCQYDNLLLVTGGVMDGAEEGKTTVVNTVNVYNCSTKTWTTPQALELPVELRSHHLVVFEEYIYVMGGAFVHPCSYGDKQFNRQAWRAQWSDVKNAVKQPFKKMQSVWKPIVPPPFVRYTVVVYKDFLLSIGGVEGEWPQKGIYKFVDGEADWMKVGEMKMGRYRHGVVPGPVESSGITLFVVGGYVPSFPAGEEHNEKTSSAQIVCL